MLRTKQKKTQARKLATRSTVPGKVLLLLLWRGNKMCKVQMLRALVNQRLNAAVEEIFVAFETTMAEYEEELCRSKQEIERQRRLLDAVFKPRVELRRHKADVPPEQQQHEPEPPRVKEEEEEEEGEEHAGKQLERLTEFSDVPPEQQQQQHESVPSYIKEEEKVGEQLEQLAEFPGRSDVRATSQDDGEERARPHRCQREETGESSDHHTVTQAHKCHFGQPQNSDMTSAYAADGTKAKPQNHENFICSDCGKTFSRPAGLKRHIRSHAGDKPFSCSFCRRSFKHRSTLERHTRVHTGEKPFSCSLCSSTFSRRTGLEDHMRIHTGEKPFGCSVCHASFTKRYTLVLHMRTHTGEKPFACRFCARTFSQQGVMRSHVLVHTGEKPFGCNVCYRRFARKYQLKKHECGRKAAGSCEAARNFGFLAAAHTH